MRLLLLSNSGGYGAPENSDTGPWSDTLFYADYREIIRDFLPKERRYVFVYPSACEDSESGATSFQKKKNIIHEVMTKGFGYKDVFYITSPHELPEERDPEQDLIIILGGNTWKLNQEFTERRLHNQITSLVAEGFPFIGHSAGANICGMNIITTNDPPESYTLYYKGLGFLPVLFNPHFPGPKNFPEQNAQRDERLQKLRTEHRFFSHLPGPEGNRFLDGNYELKEWERVDVASQPLSLPIVCLPCSSGLRVEGKTITFHEHGFLDEQSGLEIRYANGSSAQYADGDDVSFLFKDQE